jgi:hypothetical protein
MRQVKFHSHMSPETDAENYAKQVGTCQAITTVKNQTETLLLPPYQTVCAQDLRTLRKDDAEEKERDHDEAISRANELAIH